MTAIVFGEKDYTLSRGTVEFAGRPLGNAPKVRIKRIRTGSYKVKIVLDEIEPGNLELLTKETTGTFVYRANNPKGRPVDWTFTKLNFYKAKTKLNGHRKWQRIVLYGIAVVDDRGSVGTITQMVMRSETKELR